MAEHDDTFDIDPLRRQALVFVARLTSGEATSADAEALLAWRRRSEAHDRAFRDACQLWDKAGLAAASVDYPSSGEEASSGRIGLLNRRRFIVGGAAAAGAAGIMVAGAEAGLWPTLSALLADHRTGTGEQRHVTLPDGSIAELNTRTSLSVHFVRGARRVSLAEGEAAFVVRPILDSPLVVEAAGGRVSANGSTFAIRRTSDEARITCIDGSVAIGPSGSVRLTPGDQVSYHGAAIDAVHRVDLATQTAWRQGLLIFQNEPLRRVIAEINRYRTGRIVTVNVALAERQVTGVFHLDRPHEVLQHIERTLKIRAIRLTDYFIVLG